MRTHQPQRALLASLTAALAVAAPAAAAAQTGTGSTATARPAPDAELRAALAPVSGGLTAADAIRLALESGAPIERAEADARRAEVASHYAYFVWFPRLEASARYTRLSKVDLPQLDFVTPVVQGIYDSLDPAFRDVAFPGGRPMAMAPGGDDNPLFVQILDNYAFRFDLTVPVSDYFLTILPVYRATKMGESLGRVQLRTQRETVSLRAVEAYLATVRARAARRVTADSLAALAQQRDDLGALVDAGLASSADRAQVSAQLAATRIAAQQADGGVRVAELALRQILGLPAEREIRPAEDLFAPTLVAPPELDALIEEAKRERTEVQALRRMLAIQVEQLKLTHGKMLPRLTLLGAFDIANPNQRVLPLQEEFRTSWDITLRLAWSTSDFSAGWVQREEQQLTIAGIRADVRALEEAVTLEVSAARDALISARLAIDAAREGIEAATEAYDERRSLAAAGESTTTDVLAAETALRRAQLQLVNAHLDVRLAQARLDRAIGRLAPRGDDDSKDELP